MIQRISPEQMQAYGEQVEEEKRLRAAMPGGEIKEFCQWLREWFVQEQEEADRIKFGYAPIRKQS